MAVAVYLLLAIAFPGCTSAAGSYGPRYGQLADHGQLRSVAQNGLRAASRHRYDYSLQNNELYPTKSAIAKR